MTARSPTWTCRRISESIICGHRNPNRRRKCEQCGKPRPPRREPAHRKALRIPYDQYVVLNGGPDCGICHRPAPAHRRHDRDHEHHGPNRGQPRGILCPRCNRQLDRTIRFVGRDLIISWLRAAANYLERSEERCLTIRNPHRGEP